MERRGRGRRGGLWEGLGSGGGRAVRAPCWVLGAGPLAPPAAWQPLGSRPPGAVEVRSVHAVRCFRPQRQLWGSPAPVPNPGFCSQSSWFLQAGPGTALDEWAPPVTLPFLCAQGEAPPAGPQRQRGGRGKPRLPHLRLMSDCLLCERWPSPL